MSNQGNINNYLGLDYEGRKKQFYDYLKLQGKKESTAKQYAYTHLFHKDVKSVVKNKSSKGDNILDIVDVQIIKDIYKEVSPLTQNLRQGHAWSASIGAYKKFIESLLSINLETTSSSASTKELSDFKHLLEYFCAHLSFIVTNNKQNAGFQEYIEPLLTDNSFKKSGQGWKGDKIQQQIQQWSEYSAGTICINVYGSSFQGNATYLHWKGTGCNINAIWNKSEIVGLQLIHFSQLGKRNIWTPTGIECSLSELGLFNKQIPNNAVNSFFNSFVGMKKSAYVSNTSLKFSVDKIIDSLKQTNLLYEDNLIRRFVFSLLTKPFLILSGLAGSGKTQLALAFAHAICDDVDQQLCVVPVGADWTNREPLLGYPNALKTDEYIQPESGALQILIRAQNDTQKPYFLLLDEMNLSYVERYFADFLSALESHHKIPLWDKPNESKSAVPSDVVLPKNLFIIGTINVDETTYMFSPKVLDRANVIEFKVSEKDMKNFLLQAPQINIKACDGMVASMAEDFVNKAEENIPMSTEANDVLNKLFVELKKVNAEFGYRSATEIGRFISFAKDSMDIDTAIDAAIVQKLLPKLHGSRKKIVPVLKQLWLLCGTGIDIDDMEQPLVVPVNTKYKLSADKILRMYQGAVDNGFTSFAEA